MPLDRLSAVVLVMQAKPDDLIRIALPTPYPQQVIYDEAVQRWHRPRVSCMTHAMVLFARAFSPTMKNDTTLDVFGEMITKDKMEEAARRGSLRVFDVRGTSSHTWSECRHCRWADRIRG